MKKKSKANSAQYGKCGLPGEYGQNVDILITAHKYLENTPQKIGDETVKGLDEDTVMKIIEDFDLTPEATLQQGIKAGYEASCNQFRDNLSEEIDDNIKENIDDARLFFENQYQEHLSETEAKDFMPDESHNGSEAGQANLILSDLFSNCTLQELEAFEMLMRIKKGNGYVPMRDGVPHPDNVDLSVLFGKIEMAVSKKGNQYATVLIPKA